MSAFQQTGLFGQPIEPERRTRRVRPGWERLSDSRDDTTRQEFRHLRTGARVLHCGHPTALRPWFIVDAFGHSSMDTGETTRRGRPVGLCFQLLGEAMQYVEGNVGKLPGMRREP